MPNRKQARAGVATAEAVIALPFLVLILAAIAYVGQTGHRKQRMQAQARTCAWQFALTGCQDTAALPPDCQQAFGPIRADGDTRSLLADDVPAGVLDKALDEPVMGYILEQLAGRNVEAHLSDTRARPGLLGGGSLETTARTVVLCNTVPAKAELFDTLFDTYWTRANRDSD